MSLSCSNVACALPSLCLIAVPPAASQLLMLTPKSSISTFGVPSDCFAYTPLFAVEGIIIVSVGLIDKFVCTHALFCFSALGEFRFFLGLVRGVPDFEVGSFVVL